MSLLGKKWIIQNSQQEAGTLEKLFLNRGVATPQQKDAFLGLTETELHDPYLFKDMQKAVDRLEKALSEGERIIIFGDYDVDGISGTALLYNCLNKLGFNVSYRLPHRVDDGYGLSSKFVDVFKEAEAKVIITVDCGVSNYDQVEEMNQAGIDVIITDHHTVPVKIPQAYAIIHPKVEGETYPFDGLTGSGVALKLAQALYQHFNLPEEDFFKLIDLASLGTVADMGPLKGENRLIVRKGLEALQKTHWKGLEMIMQKAGINREDTVDTGTIGFQLSPRINAAGRIDTPYLALQLLLQEEESAKGKGMADKLEGLNIQRQNMTKIAIEELADFVLSLSNPKVIVKASSEWHIGIVGLIAGRAAERYGVPAIIMQDFGDHLVGSCRSPYFVNITEALRAHKELLTNFGGHENAAGFSMPKANLEAFTKAINEYFNDLFKEQVMGPELQIDCTLNSAELSLDFVKSLNQFEPFGIENKKPLFLIENCEIDRVDKVGATGSHLKIKVKKGDKFIDAIAFSFGEHFEKLRSHKSIKIVAQLDANVWKGRETLQLKVEDIAIEE